MGIQELVLRLRSAIQVRVGIRARMTGWCRTGNLALVAIKAQFQSPTILHSPRLVSQLRLLGRVDIHGFRAWASDNFLIHSHTFSAHFSSIRLLYLTLSSFSCIRLVQIVYISSDLNSSIPSMYYTIPSANRQLKIYECYAGVGTFLSLELTLTCDHQRDYLKPCSRRWYRLKFGAFNS